MSITLPCFNEPYNKKEETVKKHCFATPNDKSDTCPCCGKKRMNIERGPSSGKAKHVGGG